MLLSLEEVAAGLQDAVSSALLAHTPQPPKSQEEEEEEEEVVVEDQVEEVVVEEDMSSELSELSGARFTCFTGTKVQLLTARAHS
jgi:hypothetical protein